MPIQGNHMKSCNPTICCSDYKFGERIASSPNNISKSTNFMEQTLDASKPKSFSSQQQRQPVINAYFMSNQHLTGEASPLLPEAGNMLKR